MLCLFSQQSDTDYLLLDVNFEGLTSSLFREFLSLREQAQELLILENT